MYLKYFGFRRRPFDLVPDPDFLFLGESHDSALANLLLGIESGKGFVVIAGGVGTGKTTILHAVMRRLGRELDVAVLTQPDLQPSELLRTILSEFGVETSSEDKVALRRMLREYLEQRPRPAVLAIDEAHLLSEESLEQVRLLSNFETADRKLLQIILAGQPELKGLLSRARLRPLAQRIEMFYEIQPLTSEETTAYVLRRIQIAGQPDDLVIEPRALEEIHDRTGGVPRLINVLAERALITAYVAGTKKVSGAIVREAYKDLGEVTQRVMGKPEPEEFAEMPIEPVRFARSVDRPKVPRLAMEPANDSLDESDSARPGRKIAHWIAGIGLGAALVFTIVSLGTHRAMSSKDDARREEAKETSSAVPSAKSSETAVLPTSPPAGSETASADSTASPTPGSESSPLALLENDAASKPADSSIPTAADLEKDVERARDEAAKRESEKRDAEKREAEKRAATAAKDAGEEKGGPEVVDAPSSPSSPPEAPAPSVVLTREAPPADLKPEDVPLVDEASGSEGARYAIQCGSYRDRDRALEIVARVAASTGERARLLTTEMSSGTWYRVLLGDFESEPAARAKIGDVHEHDRLLVLQVVRLSGPGGSGS